MLYNAILSGISQLSPLDGPASNSDLVRENVNSFKGGGESAYQVAASLEKVKLLAVQFNT